MGLSVTSCDQVGNASLCQIVAIKYRTNTECYHLPPNAQACWLAANCPHDCLCLQKASILCTSVYNSPTIQAYQITSCSKPICATSHSLLAHPPECAAPLQMVAATQLSPWLLSPWPPGRLLPPWPPSSEPLPCAWLLPCRPAAPPPASLPPAAPLCCPSSSRPTVQKCAVQLDAAVCTL